MDGSRHLCATPRVLLSFVVRPTVERQSLCGCGVDAILVCCGCFSRFLSLTCGQMATSAVRFRVALGVTGGTLGPVAYETGF